LLNRLTEPPSRSNGILSSSVKSALPETTALGPSGNYFLQLEVAKPAPASVRHRGTWLMEMRGFVARGEVVAAQPARSMRNGFYISFGSEHKSLTSQPPSHTAAADSPAGGDGQGRESFGRGG